MGDKTCTRWVSVVEHVYLFDMKQCRKPLRTNNLSVSAEEAAAPLWSQQIRFLHLASQICTVSSCLLSAEPQTRGFWEVWGLTAERLNVSLQQVEQRVQRSPCWLQDCMYGVHNHSITGLNLVQDTCCLSPLSGFGSTLLKLNCLWYFINSPLIPLKSGRLATCFDWRKTWIKVL